MSFSDADFFLRQSEDERGWLQPVCLALVFHIVTLALSATLPELINRRPILDDVVTVNLVSLPEMTQAPKQETPGESQPQQPDKLEKIEPEQGKVPVALQQNTTPVKAEPAKPVSLKPMKRKVRVTDPAKLAEEQAKRQRELERQKALAQARQLEKQADEDAARARAALAEMIRQKGAQTSAVSSRRSSSGRQEVQSIVLKQYLSSLYDRVQQYWVLPEMRQWDADLETVVVLTIRNDGSVARKVIESKSKDPFFDQFVMKTIQKSMPMPRFPKLMPQASIEVGLRFRPGELMTM